MSVLVSVDVARRCGIERDEELPAWAWPGGYPLVYVAMEFQDYPGWVPAETATLCPACANLASYRADIVSVDVHWEGDPMQCDMCGALVESAYGPLEVCDD